MEEGVLRGGLESRSRGRKGAVWRCGSACMCNVCARASLRRYELAMAVCETGVPWEAACVQMSGSIRLCACNRMGLCV